MHIMKKFCMDFKNLGDLENSELHFFSNKLLGGFFPPEGCVCVPSPSKAKSSVFSFWPSEMAFTYSSVPEERARIRALEVT